MSPEMKMQVDFSVAIANRIYDILESKGLSQKDFSRMIGKTETEVSRWLSGTHNFTLATLCKISAALNEDIIKVSGQPSYPTYEEESLFVAEPV